MKLLTSLAVIATTTSAWADPTQVFPLTGELPPESRGTLDRLTSAIADLVDGEISSVSIEDAAGLLECDVEATPCLEKVSSSVGGKQLVFGTVVKGEGTTLKVTLTRFRPGPDRQQQTFEITDQDEAYPDELARKAAPLFGITPRATRAIEPEPPVAPTEPIVDGDRAGTITAGTWGLIGGGVLGVMVGTGFTVSARGLRADVENAPRETRDDFDRLVALEDKGQFRTRAGAVLLVAGGVALTAGLVRAMLQRQSPARDEEQVVSVTPISGGAAVFVTWRMP